jgi:hypothetical protein
MDRVAELMIDWRGLPSGSRAQVYFPAMSVDDILALANSLYASHHLERVDSHTVGCTAETVSYIPVVGAAGTGLAGLLSVDLPLGVTKGDLFDVLVRELRPTELQLRRDTVVAKASAAEASTRLTEVKNGLNAEWQRVGGGFQVTVPVSTKTELLSLEERSLSILRWIGEDVPATSRWRPIFDRYLGHLAARVSGFGGDPDRVHPSPDGVWWRRHRGDVMEGRHCSTGKVVGVIYDRFGDFAGFLLETDGGRERRYLAREHEIADLVVAAWRDRAVITVCAHSDDLTLPVEITLRTAPRPAQN